MEGLAMEGRQNPALPQPSAGSLPWPARGSEGEPGVQERVAGEPPAPGHTAESPQSPVLCPCWWSCSIPSPALRLEQPGGFCPPWGGGEGRSEQAELRAALPGLEVSWEPRAGAGAQPLAGTSRDPTVGARSLTWFWSLGGMERMVLLSTSPMRNSDTLRQRNMAGLSRGGTGSDKQGCHPAPQGPGKGQGSGSCRTGVRGDGSAQLPVVRLRWRSRAWPSTEEGWGDGARGLEQALGFLPSAGGITGGFALPAGSLCPQTTPQTRRHVRGHAWVRGWGEGWRRVLASEGGGVHQGPSLGDSWAKAPYVLLKDTAMVSTAFSNSRLSVSLLDS